VLYYKLYEESRLNKSSFIVSLQHGAKTDPFETGHVSCPAREVGPCRDTSLIRKRLPSYDPPRTLGIGLRYGPRGVRFLVSEVPMYGPSGWQWPIHFVIQVRLLRIRSVAVPQQWCAPKMVVGILLLFYFSQAWS